MGIPYPNALVCSTGNTLLEIELHFRHVNNDIYLIARKYTQTIHSKFNFQQIPQFDLVNVVNNEFVVEESVVVLVRLSVSNLPHWNDHFVLIQFAEMREIKLTRLEGQGLHSLCLFFIWTVSTNSMC